MAANVDTMRQVAAVGQTPGYMAESQSDGTYKLVRLPVPEHGVEKKSIVVSPRSHDRQQRNNITRAKNELGWTWELYEACEQATRSHRLAQTDPAEDHLKLLLAALGVDPTQPQPGGDAIPGPRRRRHAGGGTATGSAKKPDTAAAAAPPTLQPAPIVKLPTDVYIQLELISPERAMDLLLNLAPYQRETKNHRASGHAGAMVRGEWLANPADAGCVDTNGQTCNGAHRFQAIFESGTSQPMWMAYNVPPETYRVMDRGAKRTTADMLHGGGETASRDLAALAKMAFLWFNVDQGEWSRAAADVTEAQVYNLLEEHPGLRESVKLGRINGGMYVSRTAAMLAHYLISRNMGGDSRLVTRWYESISGVELSRYQPGHTLGLYFLGSKPGASRRKALVGRTRREADMYLIIQAWNNTCLGKEMRSVGAPHADFRIADPLTPMQDKHQFLPFA